MTQIIISGRTEEIKNLEREFNGQGLKFNVKTEKDQFLPSPYKEIAIALTPMLIKILYDYLMRAKKTDIKIQVDDLEMELKTNAVKKLELKLKSEEATPGN